MLYDFSRIISSVNRAKLNDKPSQPVLVANGVLFRLNIIFDLIRQLSDSV